MGSKGGDDGLVEPPNTDSEFLITGEVQFWRMPPERWPSALRTARDVGIQRVSTYLSWRRHEPRRGAPDLKGRYGPELDVHRFLQLCRDLNLEVQLKPGPWICAEEPGGGLPDWVLADSSIIALDHDNRPVMGYNWPFKHPMPSYASQVFRDMTRKWITFVWKDLSEFLSGEGPIMATQLDNEPSLGFQDSMYGFDYHPESIKKFRNFVISKYGSLEAVASAWGMNIGALEDVQPPQPDDKRSAEPYCDLREHDWITYQQLYICDYLRWLQQINEESGAGRLTDFVNLNTHPVRGMPQSGPEIVRALRSSAKDVVVGEDHYFIPPLAQEDIMGLALAAAQGIASGTSLVWAPEMQAGIWRSPGESVTYPDPTETEIAAWWALGLALGYKGFNLYMLVNRENWELSPIHADGTPTALLGAVKSLLTTVRSVTDISSYRPVAQACLVWDTESLRDAYRVRGTQAAPNTEWDNPASRQSYNTLLDHAAVMTRNGVHYRVCSLEDTDPRLPLVRAVTKAEDVAAIAPIIEAPHGVLARLHRAPSGEELLYVVVWARDVPLSGVRLSFTQCQAVRLRSSCRDGDYAVVNGVVVLGHLNPGLNLFHVLRA